MGYPAGRRRDRITFERATIGTDGYGGEVQTWAAIGSRSANVNYGNGDERREAAQTKATVPATFRVPRDPLTRSLTAKDRITFDGGIWNITAPPVPTLEKDSLDIAAVRGA
jgi:SPP1 family predicted phage head-tail adaptor